MRLKTGDEVYHSVNGVGVVVEVNGSLIVVDFLDGEAGPGSHQDKPGRWTFHADLCEFSRVRRGATMELGSYKGSRVRRLLLVA